MQCRSVLVIIFFAVQLFRNEITSKQGSLVTNFENYAFIDANNLHLGTRDAGWIPDYFKLLQYLKSRYNVTKAFYFIGKKVEEQQLYDTLISFGYKVIFRPPQIINGELKANCDTDLVLHCMIEYNNYNKAVIISGDGDFCSLVEYLKENEKLRMVLVPNKKKFSHLLAKASKGQMCSMDDLKETLAHSTF